VLSEDTCECACGCVSGNPAAFYGSTDTSFDCLDAPPSPPPPPRPPPPPPPRPPPSPSPPPAPPSPPPPPPHPPSQPPPSPPQFCPCDTLFIDNSGGPFPRGKTCDSSSAYGAFAYEGYRGWQPVYVGTTVSIQYSNFLDSDDGGGRWAFCENDGGCSSLNWIAWQTNYDDATFQTKCPQSVTSWTTYCSVVGPSANPQPETVDIELTCAPPPSPPLPPSPPPPPPPPSPPPPPPSLAPSPPPSLPPSPPPPSPSSPPSPPSASSSPPPSTPLNRNVSPPPPPSRSPSLPSPPSAPPAKPSMPPIYPGGGAFEFLPSGPPALPPPSADPAAALSGGAIAGVVVASLAGCAFFVYLFASF